MYLVSVEVKRSAIDGLGVFAKYPINKGTVVWQFEASHDQVCTVDDFESLAKAKQDELKRVAYLSPTTNRWVYPPEDDPARFTNHSNENNLSVVIDPSVSEEPYFIANKNIAAGQELTNNYREFDQITQRERPKWA